MITHQSKLYEPVQTGPWSGYRELPTTAAEPLTRWSGSKIPRSLVQQIISFFEWSMKETQSEVVVTLFYHAEHGWAALVLPQEGYGGMTVRLLDDHPNRIPTYQRLGRGWSPMGSWHHHCAASAFASGTDQHDEKSKEGIHLTTGGLGSAQYSLHARTSFRHVVTPAVLSDWFECDAHIAPTLRDKQIEWELCQPVNGEFPDWWSQNVIKVERPVQIWTPSPTVGGYEVGQNKPKWFNWQLQEVIQKHGIQPDEIYCEMLRMSEDEVTSECVALMLYSEMDLEDAIKHLREVHGCGAKDVAVESDDLEYVSAITHHAPECMCVDCQEVRTYYAQ